MLELSCRKFTEKYNEALLNGIDIFRTAHKVLLLRGFTFNVSYYYASKGDAPAPDNLVRTKAVELEATTRGLLKTVTKCTFEVVGDGGLVTLRLSPPNLAMSSNVISLA